MRFIWLCFCWGTLLIVVSAAIIGVYALNQVNSQLRQHVLKEFEKRYPDLEIDIGSVQLDEQKGISIRRLECLIPNEPGLPRRRLLFIEELYLECPVTFQALYRQEIRINKIVVRDPYFRLTRSANGQFEELKRLKTPIDDSKPVPIEVFGGTLLYEDLALGQSNPLKFDELYLLATPPEQSKRTELLSDLDPNASPIDAWMINFRAKGDMLRQLNVNGFFVPAMEDRQIRWNLNVHCKQLDWSLELLKYLRLPYPLGGDIQYQKSLESFQGQLDFSLVASSDSFIPEGIRFELNGSLLHGRAELYNISRMLSNLTGRFRVTNEGVAVEKLTGMVEAARFVLNYSQDGLKKTDSAQLTTTVQNLNFDRNLVEALSPFLNESTKTLLNRFEYSGTTDLDASVKKRADRWLPDSLELNFSELNFAFSDFPYKVDHLSGKFIIDSNAVLRFNLVGGSDHPLRPKIIGQYGNVFVDPVGQVEIWGQDVPIDTKLFASIPLEQREVIQSLRPEGKVNAYLKIELPPNDLPLKKRFEIGLNNVSVQYEKFPYPLQKIDGLIRLENMLWTFENMVGTNESASVTGNGHLKPVELPDPVNPMQMISSMELFLALKAESLPVDGQLADALLDPNQSQLLSGLKAKGKIDLNASVRYYSHDKRLNLEFRAIPLPEFSVRPEYFPYRIDNLSGEILYNNGVVHSRRLTGENRNMKLTAGLLCQFAPEGQWVFQLNPLVVEQLSPNRELQEALPSDLQRIFDCVQIERPLNLKGFIEFFKPNANAPLCTVWDSTVVLHQNSANVGFPVKNIFGEIRLSGFAENSEFRLAGDLNLDSAMIRGFQATRLSGPFFYDGRKNSSGFQQFYIGQPALKAMTLPPDIPQLQAFRRSPWFDNCQSARPIRGNLFDGELLCTGLVLVGSNMSYIIDTSLAGADMAKIAMDLEPTAQKITGTLNLQSHFRGDGRKMEALGGRGKIELRNANIYDAPGMLRLLRELSVRETDPNAGAFSSADINYYLQGNRVVFDPIIFEGTAFSLAGSGEMRLDNRHINLIMKTRLGNRRTQIPIVSDILGGAGDQIVQLNIAGPLSDPTVHRVALPEIQRVIREIQGEDTTDYGTHTTPSRDNQTTLPDRMQPSKFLPWR